MKRKSIYIIIVLLITQSTVNANEEDYYYKMNKSFEVFGAIFRYLTNNYVIEIAPEELINEGINGMLNSLDPYNEYFQQEDNQDLDLLSSGSYVGLGITVGVRDSMLTIVGVRDNTPSKLAGIRIGDRILSVNDNFLLYGSNEDLRLYTRGKTGEELNLAILRDGIQDTLRFKVARQEISVNYLTYAGMINDSIGIIRIERFSRNIPFELRNAFSDLKRRYNLKSLIIDLRDNPGGLLYSAVASSELFLPLHSPIVSTKGKNISENRTYNSFSNPLDTNIGLVVLINGLSASASEVLAGAIQDHDRGIIIGERSLGKGLVQSLFQVPHNTLLKMTTSKYYTPSGRCIHRLTYNPNKKNQLVTTSEDSIFYTKKGRPVYEAKGIIPDTIVIAPELPEYVKDLIRHNKFFNFANLYCAKLDSLPNDFRVDSSLLMQFKEFVEESNYHYISPLDKAIDILRISAAKENLSLKLQKDIAEISDKIKIEQGDLIYRYEKEVATTLDYEISRRFKTEAELFAKFYKEDKYIQTALMILSNPKKYDYFLSNEKQLNSYPSEY